MRVGYQTIEFLKYQHIIFPRPEAQHLLAIKQGKVSFHEVTEEIESLLMQIEEALKQTSLPDTYERYLVDDFIEHVYLEQIKKRYL